MERNALVDKLKGYACFLVLFGHVIMGIRLGGVNVPECFPILEKFIWSFHVALFLFLSGVVYKITGEWRGKKSKGNFILYKLISLGIPYVVFSSVYILINSFVGGANTNSSAMDILFIWREPVAQYWFLYALFFIFCIWTVFSGLLKNWQITLIMFLVAYLVPAFGGSFGCFDVVFYTAWAFGLGTVVDITKLYKGSAVFKVAGTLIHIVAGVLLVVLNKIESPFFKELMIIIGIYASILFISLIGDIKLVSKFLDFINKYSFQIYLLHTIFTSGIRIVLIKLNITSWAFHVVAGCVAGIAFSVLASVIAKKIKFINFFFFPTKGMKLFKREITICYRRG